jgi:hypothetical protein
MLLLSSFWGRGGGIILLGLMATFALVVSTAAHEADWHGGRPQRIHLGGTWPAGWVPPAYSFGTGKLTLDLTRSSDLRQLDGRTLDLTGKVGQIDVYLPENACPRVHATIAGPGRILQQGQVPSGTATDSHGFGVTVDHLLTGPAGCVSFTLDAHLGVGQIEIDRY